MVGTPTDWMSSGDFGPYRLTGEKLGEGGMGIVWLAERKDAGNQVAIKFLLHAGLSPTRRERFTREIKTLAKLKHPFIARLYDAGALSDGTPWFVMEYVKGVGFTEYCREAERSFEDNLSLFRLVCQAVQYAHSQEIIHRDLKPSNILVERDGTPRLLDFGIAREFHAADEELDRTRPGLCFMTPEYAAPEWIGLGTVGFFTDVYSLGIMFYEMLTGHVPLKHDGPETDFAKPSTMVKQRATLGKAAWNDLDVLCLKAIHNDPHQRYQSVEALQRDVEHYLNKEPLEAQPDTLRYRLGKFVARNRRAVLASSLTAVLVISLVVFFAIRLAKARNMALTEADRSRTDEQFMTNLFAGGDKEAGPADDLRVVTLLDRGIQEAHGLSGEPQVQAQLEQTLGSSFQKLGKIEKANSLLDSALKRRRSIFGPDHEKVAESLLALALLRVDQGQLVEAERLTREALAMRSAICRPAIHRLRAQRPLLDECSKNRDITIKHLKF